MIQTLNHKKLIESECVYNTAIWPKVKIVCIHTFIRFVSCQWKSFECYKTIPVCFNQTDNENNKNVFF